MAERKLALFEVVAHKSSYYTTSDLDYLQSVLDNILTEMRKQNDPRADAWNLAALKIQLSSALFRCADRGERDFAALKRHALSAIPMPSVRWPAQPVDWPDDAATAEFDRRDTRPSSQTGSRSRPDETHAAPPASRLCRVK